jgi:hypothetical protein
VHGKNASKPFANESIECVRQILNLEAPDKVDMVTSILAVSTLHKLDNDGIGNRGGVYKKVKTGKGSASIHELQLCITRNF